MEVLRIIPIACLLALFPLVAAFCQPLPQQSAAHASLSDRELTVATKQAAPFAMKGPDGSWQGISIDLWRRLADQLHLLRYHFVEATAVQDLSRQSRSQ